MLHRSFALCAFVLSIACGDVDRDAHDVAPLDADASRGAGGEDDVGHRCDEGDTRKCRIKIAEHEGVVTCAEGVRTCVDGAWSECEPLPVEDD